MPFQLRNLRTHFLTCLMACTLMVKGHAVEGYRIEVHIKGLQDSTTYLAYHFGERQFLKDTATADHQGNFIFEGSERLLSGMYLVVLPGNTYFEVIVDEHQDFSIASEMGQITERISFKGSPDNTSFYDYIAFLRELNQESSLLRSTLQDEEADASEKEHATRRLAEIENAVRKKQDELIAGNPASLFARILLAQQNPDLSDISEEEKDNPEHADRTYHLYKQRFWDKIDFADDRLLRTPVYHAMLNRYFNQFLMQIPDTMIRYVDLLVEKSRAHSEVFRYTLWFVANNFERSQIMGMDAVFVHIIDTYYSTGEASWMADDALKRIQERADRLRPTLIGQVAPDIRAWQANGQPTTLHQVDSDYVVVYFWESDCGHCQRETPALMKVYETYKPRGLEVFALNVEADTEKWKQAVEKYGTTWINASDPHNRSGFRELYDVYAIPLIVLLDKDKNIIAKRISAEQLDGFLQFLFEGEKKP